MIKFIKLIKNDDKGATAIEYGLIAALIAVAIISAVSAVGTNLNSTFTNVAGGLSGAEACRYGGEPAPPAPSKHLAYRNGDGGVERRRRFYVCARSGHRRRERPRVIGSGFGGGRQPAGGLTFCWLVPSPIAPGCWRSSPIVSAASASASDAPPRTKAIRSRTRRASS